MAAMVFVDPIMAWCARVDPNMACPWRDTLLATAEGGLLVHYIIVASVS